MIARVSVNPAGLLELGDGIPPGEAFARHRALCRKLEAHAILRVGSEKESSEFRQALGALKEASPDAFRAWAVLIKAFNSHGRSKMISPPRAASLAEIAALRDLRAGWGERTEIAVLTGEQSDALGVDPNAVSTVDPESGIDLAPVSRAAEARTLNQFSEQATESMLGKGESRDLFFDRFVGPIAMWSTEVVIYDRYLFGDLSKRGLRNEDPGADPKEHVGWLLSRLDRIGGPAKRLGIRLIGSWTPTPDHPGGAPDSSEHAARLVTACWTPSAGGAIASVDITAARYYGAGMPHARHLRSNLGVGITMEPGFSRFSKPTITDVNGVEWIYRFRASAMEKYLTGEQQVLRSKDTKPIRIHPA